MGYKGTRIINIDYDVYEKLLAKDGNLTDLEKAVKSSVPIGTFITLANTDFQKCLGVRPSVPKRSTRRINELLDEMGESKIYIENSKDFLDGFETAIDIISHLMDKETAEKKNSFDDIYDKYKADKEQEEEENEL